MENDNLNIIDAAHHIDNIRGVSGRESRKNQQEKKQKKKDNKNVDIDLELEKQLQYKNQNNDESHIDYKA